MSTVPFMEPILTTLRENRLVLERLVQWKGVDPGMIFSVMDCGVYALALQLVAHDAMEAQLDALGAANGPIRLAEADGLPTLDAAGRHAWLVAEPALDIAVDDYWRTGVGELAVLNLVEPKQLGVVAAIAEKHGLAAEVRSAGPGPMRIVVRPPVAGGTTLLDRIRREGIPAKRASWFDLLALSSHALAEDTLISRTHTGSFVVKPDGTVLGRTDSEFREADITLLTAERLEFRR